MEIQNKVKLASYCTYRVGGPADYLCKCKSVSEILESVKHAQENELDYVVVGAGSNVLFSDAGFRGLVIVNNARGSKFDKKSVIAESGCLLSSLVSRCAEAGLSGLENLAGIPGTVGGAIYGNAGAHGSSVSDYLTKVSVLRQGREVILKKNELSFGYRKSSFQDNKDIILSASFSLKKGDPDETKAKKQEALKKRAKSPKGFSCGSFFKNPDGESAGALIEKAGLKGKSVAGANVAEQHANYIVNTGDATASDIYRLSKKAKDTVQKKFGIELKREVRLIGKFE
jgi:UDP-N-acetylmuramate dehydrogenase